MAAGLLLGIVAAGLAVAAALRPEPAVSLRVEIEPQDLERAIDLLRDHDPRRSQPGQLRAVALNERDLQVLINHATREWPGAASRVEFRPGTATVTLSRSAPRPFAGWINIHTHWVQTGGLPALESVRVGELPVPTWLGRWAGLRWIESAELHAELQLAADVVKRVRFTPGQLQLTYAWRDDSARRVMQALLPAAEEARLRAYARHLASFTALRRPPRVASLSELLVPTFELARQRTADGGDAAAENRSAIVVLALLASGRQLQSLLPMAREGPRARPLRLLLAGRDDFPRHFLVSAALMVESTGALAQSIGLAKEVDDARGGSGFSFNDMAANLAGTRFGEMAMRAPVELQALVAAGVTDDDLMPAWDDLPQFMPEAEFLHRYGGVGAPPYQAMMAEIDRRVGALRLFR